MKLSDPLEVAGVIGTPHGCWQQNSDPLQEQNKLLTPEPSLHHGESHPVLAPSPRDGAAHSGRAFYVKVGWKLQQRHAQSRLQVDNESHHYTF